MYRLFFPLILGLLASGIAAARNIDLSTVPARDSVQLTIYNSEDLTLVRETRVLSFKRGTNPLQFSWANTRIDPTSVQLRFLTHGAELELLDTTFPHDKPQMLYWNVASDHDGEAEIEISYFTSGITWKADYVAIINRQESRAHVESFVTVTNHSGENYPNAQVRLVVGTINLVERVEQLARGERPSRRLKAKAELRQQVARSAMSIPAAAAAEEAFVDAKNIAKEGLSEYFIYRVEGTETIPNGWSKRMLSFSGEDVPVKVAYRYRLHQYGDQLVRLYLFKNDKESNLGTTPLPDGVVNIFRDNGRGGMGFLGRKSTSYVPIGDKFELNLGPDPNVQFELAKSKVYRDNLWMRLSKGNKYRRVNDDTVVVDRNAKIVGWDLHEVYEQRIRNFTDRPINVEIRRRFDRDVVFRSSLNPTRHDFRTITLAANVGAGQTRSLLYEVLIRQGRNAKQRKVDIETASIGRPSYR